MFFMLNMKAFVSLLLLTAVAAEKVYDTECPPEQADDWTIEKLLRHEDCDKFYKCTFGKPVVMLCPSDLWFNLDAWQCDYPHNVNCSGRNEPTLSTTDVTTPIPENTPTLKTTISTTTVPTTPTSTTTAKTTTTENVFSENGCPINPHVHWLLPHETDCNLFFHCVWGEKVLRECPKPLHFNKVTQVCDFSYRAGCSKSFDKNARRRREILTKF